MSYEDRRKAYDVGFVKGYDKAKKDLCARLFGRSELGEPLEGVSTEDNFIARRIDKWQRTPFVRPIRCKANSLHQPLITSSSQGSLVLKCYDCGYSISFDEIPIFFKDSAEWEKVVRVIDMITADTLTLVLR